MLHGPRENAHPSGLARWESSSVVAWASRWVPQEIRAPRHVRTGPQLAPRAAALWPCCLAGGTPSPEEREDGVSFRRFTENGILLPTVTAVHGLILGGRGDPEKVVSLTCPTQRAIRR